MNKCIFLFTIILCSCTHPKEGDWAVWGEENACKGFVISRTGKMCEVEGICGGLIAVKGHVFCKELKEEAQ